MRRRLELRDCIAHVPNVVRDDVDGIASLNATGEVRVNLSALCKGES